MGAMSVRSLLPDLGTPATGTPEAAVPPFARAVLWAHGDDAWRGEGGWTVLLDGTDRLRRLSALWQAAVAGRPDPATRQPFEERGVAITVAEDPIVEVGL